MTCWGAIDQHTGTRIPTWPGLPNGLALWQPANGSTATPRCVLTSGSCVDRRPGPAGGPRRTAASVDLQLAPPVPNRSGPSPLDLHPSHGRPPFHNPDPLSSYPSLRGGAPLPAPGLLRISHPTGVGEKGTLKSAPPRTARSHPTPAPTGWGGLRTLGSAWKMHSGLQRKLFLILSTPMEIHPDICSNRAKV